MYCLACGKATVVQFLCVYGKVAPSGHFIRLIGYNLAFKINYTYSYLVDFLRFPIVAMCIIENDVYQ